MGAGQGLPSNQGRGRAQFRLLGRGCPPSAALVRTPSSCAPPPRSPRCTFPIALTCLSLGAACRTPGRAQSEAEMVSARAGAGDQEGLVRTGKETAGS